MNLLFRIKTDELVCPPIEVNAHTTETLSNGMVKEVYLRYFEPNLYVTMEALKDPAYAVTKYTAILHNGLDRPVRLYQLDAGVAVPADDVTVRYFSSDWGTEFIPHSKKLEGEFSFASVAGRSSKGFEPWCGLETPNGCYSAAMAWSGCWNCRITPAEGHTQFSMGLTTEEFFTDVQPGERFVSPSFYLAQGNTLEEACLEQRRYFRKHLSLLNDGGIADVPYEYNTWWPYEDSEINEDIFQQNAEIAKKVGCRYAMLDAGWFGGNEEGQSWYEKRGDWEIVNQEKFPSGMKALCDKAKAVGILPGIWCEIEAVGKDAKLNETHPNIIAKRDGKSLGYVCLASKEARDWAMSIIDRIAGEYGAKWIKFDYNLDPAPGCNAEGHGHGKGDGLYAHYLGYYQLLDEIHRKYPDVVIENCASGGLRMDIEMASHCHFNFLSDPDYTEFHLQCYWGALSYLHQSALLHFSWSQVLKFDKNHNLGVREPITEDWRFDFMIRAVLMGIPGFSYRLPDLSEWCLKRIKDHEVFYSDIYEDYILNGDAYRLTAQPVIGGKGERFPVFELVSSKKEAVIFGFRLLKAGAEKTVALKGLDGNALYKVSYMDSGETYSAYGRELMDSGISFRGLPEEGSEIITVRLNSEA